MAEDISKLPKWAQRHIETLEMRLRETRKRIETEYDVDKSLVLLDPYDTPPIALRDHSLLEFYPHGRSARLYEYVQVRIEQNSESPLLSIRTGGHLAILPNASNSILIDARDQRYVKGRYADRT